MSKELKQSIFYIKYYAKKHGMIIERKATLDDECFEGVHKKFGYPYKKYVDINATTWAVTSPSGSPPTDYKEITVRVDIPGGDSYTQLRAIKSAKTIQNYTLTYSPYGN